MTTNRRTLFALFSIAFGLRILYAATLGTQADINPIPITPSVRYAQEITSGLDWIKEPYSPAAPGYPVLLAGAFLLSGGSLWAGIILQAILGGLTVLIVYYLGQRLGGSITGLFAALWLSLYVHHIHFTSILHRSIFACLLLILLLHLISKPFHKMRYAIFSALAYTALVFVDPQYLLLLPFIAVFLLLRATKHTLLNLHYFFLFAGFLLLLSLPWTIRNYIVYGQPIPVSLEASRYIGPVIGGRDEVAKAVEKAHRFSRTGRLGSNAIEFWRVARFTSQNADDRTLQRGQQPEKAWSLRHNLVSLITYGLLLPFFIIGIIAAIRDRNRTGLLIAATTLVYFVIRVFFGGSEMTRLPIEPFIILLAFYGLFRVVYALQKKPAAP